MGATRKYGWALNILVFIPAEKLLNNTFLDTNID
jgi:hypothetical protein